MHLFNLPNCFLIVALFASLGCERRTVNSYAGMNGTGTVPAARNIAGAQELYAQALPLLTSDKVNAEELLRKALDEDLYHGPAHNNLGVLLLEQGQIYQAVVEFEWARKLLPGHPDPRVNLAIALDRADKHNDAMEAAKSAIEVQPGNLPAIQTLAFIQVQNAITDEQTGALLATIAERSEDQEWREWARSERMKWEIRRENEASQ